MQGVNSACKPQSLLQINKVEGQEIQEDFEGLMEC